MSVYVTLNTSIGPNLGDVIEFAELAKALGLDPKTTLSASRTNSQQLSVVVPLDHLPLMSSNDE